MLPISFHTKISAALADPSTWAAIAGIVTASVAIPESPYRWLIVLCGIFGVILKDEPPTSSP